MILLLFFVQPALCKVFFHSDFERGETFTATALEPGQKTIRVMENSRLNEWPMEGGYGIVEGNLPSQSETFQYALRKANRLKGITGIKKHHANGAEICFGDLYEWYTDTLSSANWGKRKISATHENALFGNYSAKFT